MKFRLNSTYIIKLKLLGVRYAGAFTALPLTKLCCKYRLLYHIQVWTVCCHALLPVRVFLLFDITIIIYLC